MNTPAKIQIDSNLSDLAKAHQELLAHFESMNSKTHPADKPTPRESGRNKVPSASTGRRRSE